MSIPFFLNYVKPNKHKIESKFITDIGLDLDDIRNKIVYLIQEQISHFDYLPTDYDEFISKCWYKDESVDSDPFQYKIFNNNEWVSPWHLEDLYDDVYDILHKLELINEYINIANKNEDDDTDDNQILYDEE